jgi:hypothetical protein
VRGTRLCVIAVATLMALVGLGQARAGTRMSYAHFGFSKPVGYDYAPSILWDGAKWVMFHCGYDVNLDYSSDAIYRSESTDGVQWSEPAIVLRVGEPGAWDDRHVCDPTVLTAVSIKGYSWAMWYTGIGGRGADTLGPNKIGLALSHDGVHWTKLPGGPVISCGNDPSVFGCLQPSVVKDGATFRMSHTEYLCRAPSCRLNRLRSSTDGIRWDKDRTFVLPQLSVGPDFVKGNDGWWYAVMGGNTRCGATPNPDGEIASEIIVYRSPTMWADRSVAQHVGCLSYDDVVDPSTGLPAGRFLAEQGFFRDQLGRHPRHLHGVWVGFGAGHVQYHDVSEEIRGAQLPV